MVWVINDDQRWWWSNCRSSWFCWPILITIGSVDQGPTQVKQRKADPENEADTNLSKWACLHKWKILPNQPEIAWRIAVLWHKVHGIRALISKKHPYINWALEEELLMIFRHRVARCISFMLPSWLILRTSGHSPCRRAWYFTLKYIKHIAPQLCSPFWRYESSMDSFTLRIIGPSYGGVWTCIAGSGSSK